MAFQSDERRIATDVRIFYLCRKWKGIQSKCNWNCHTAELFRFCERYYQSKEPRNSRISNDFNRIPVIMRISMKLKQNTSTILRFNIIFLMNYLRIRNWKGRKFIGKSIYEINTKYKWEILHQQNWLCLRGMKMLNKCNFQRQFASNSSSKEAKMKRFLDSKFHHSLVFLLKRRFLSEEF